MAGIGIGTDMFGQIPISASEIGINSEAGSNVEEAVNTLKGNLTDLETEVSGKADKTELPTRGATADLTNLSTWYPSHSGFYTIHLNPSSSASVYARFVGKNGQVLARLNSSSGGEVTALIYVEEGVGYTIQKSTSGISYIKAYH